MWIADYLDLSEDPEFRRLNLLSRQIRDVALNSAAFAASFSPAKSKKK